MVTWAITHNSRDPMERIIQNELLCVTGLEMIVKEPTHTQAKNWWHIFNQLSTVFNQLPYLGWFLLSSAVITCQQLLTADDSCNEKDKLKFSLTPVENRANSSPAWRVPGPELSNIPLIKFSPNQSTLNFVSLIL